MDERQGIDQFLEAVQICVDAFGICEIGREFSLRCAAIDRIIVHLVLSGQGFLECAHGRIPLSEGTVVIVPKKVAKNLSGAGPIEKIADAQPNCVVADGLVRFSAFDGKPDLILGCAELSTSIGASLPLFDQAKRPIVEKSDDPILSTLFSLTLQELSSPRLGSRAFVSALMKQVLIVILRSQPDDESSILLQSGARLAGAVAAILEHPGRNHTVESLAAAAGMSRSRFCSHFTTAYDCTPKAFVQTARLSAAARMLRASELPIKAVAASVGYSSRSHFSRAFHRKFGVDPTRFRLQTTD
jgi:AraC family transcriptional regulator, activator of mtrCDE